MAYSIEDEGYGEIETRAYPEFIKPHFPSYEVFWRKFEKGSSSSKRGRSNRMSYFRRLLSAELWHFLVGRGGVGRRPRSSRHQWRSRFFVVSLAFSQPEARHRADVLAQSVHQRQVVTFFLSQRRQLCAAGSFRLEPVARGAASGRLRRDARLGVVQPVLVRLPVGSVSGSFISWNRLSQSRLGGRVF